MLLLNSESLQSSGLGNTQEQKLLYRDILLHLDKYAPELVIPHLLICEVTQVIQPPSVGTTSAILSRQSPFVCIYI